MLQAKIAEIKQAIAVALKNRRPGIITKAPVQILAVSKTRSCEEVQAVLAAGIEILAENKVQEAKIKKAQLATGTWHLIGHLQTNKIKQAVAMFTLIQSVDSERVLREISRVATEQEKIQEILLQVNIAQEASKFGLRVEEMLPLASLACELPNIKLRGLMIIGPHTADKELQRKVFAQGYQQFVALQAVTAQADILSMGMSQDYLVAIQEGANMVRLGSKIFGERNYK